MKTPLLQMKSLSPFRLKAQVEDNVFVCLFVVVVWSLTGSGIVESNPGKFRLGDNELQERRDFVERTRKSVQVSELHLLIN